MAVCVLFVIAVAAAAAALLNTGRPIPRHVFIVGMFLKLSQSEVEQENAIRFWKDAA